MAWGGKNTLPFKLINQLDAAVNCRLIVCRLNTAQNVSGIFMPIIRSLSTAAAASGFTVGTWWQQCYWSWSVRLLHLVG
jgi:hypothetical protein